jgi:biotin transporter BioY
MIDLILFSYLPNVVLSALLATILWKAGFRGVWLVSCVGPMIAGPIGLWFLQISVQGKWAGIALRIVLPFLIKWCALFLLAFKQWPRATADLNRLET